MHIFVKLFDLCLNFQLATHELCIRIYRRLDIRIFKFVGPEPVDFNKFKTVTPFFDKVLKYLNESVYAEFDQLAKINHSYRDADLSATGKLDSIAMDIFDEYISMFRNEIVKTVDDIWIQIKNIYPDTFLKKAMIITKKKEIIQLSMKSLHEFEKMCFWVPFTIPIIDEAMHLDASREPPRSFDDNVVRMLYGTLNRSLTFKEVRRISMALDDLRTESIFIM